MHDPLHDQPHGLTRRHLLKGFGAGSLVVPSLLQQVLMTLAARGDGPAGGASGKILVLLELDGGNDSLGTLVPWENSHYQAARPALKLDPANGLLAAGSAPSIGGGNQNVALHPALVNMKQAWDDGDLAAINGVGYPNPNLSHFTSFDYFHTAEPNSFVDDGWLGRYLGAQTAGLPPTAAVQFGSRSSLSLKSSAGPVPAVTIGSADSFRWLETYRNFHWTEMENVFRKSVGLDRAVAPSVAGEPALGAVRDAARATLAGSREMQATLARGAAKGGFPHSPFPSSGIGGDLYGVARLIHGDSPTSLYQLGQGGYDTHGGQIQTGSPTLGRHANLLGELDAALGAFIAEMKAEGNWDRVVICLYSEFGRKVIENGSAGTDHGAAQTIFVLGGGINAGHYGRLPDLSPGARIKNDSLVPNVDFRQVYRTLLERWLDAPPSSLAEIFPQQPADFSLLEFL